MKKKLAFFFAFLCMAITVVAQPRKGAYTITNDRIYSDVSGSYSIPNKEIDAGEWNNFFTHQGDGKMVGYEIASGVTSDGLLSISAGIGTSNYQRNNKDGISNSDHYFHIGILAGVDGYYGSPAFNPQKIGQQKSVWKVQPSASLIISYLSKINDEETKAGSIDVQSYSHYSNYGFTTKTEASYYVNEWFCPGIMYSTVHGIVPLLGLEVSNSFKIQLGYAFKEKQVTTSLVFDEFF